MINVKERKESGIGAAPAKMDPYVYAPEVLREEPGCKTGQPLVEITEEDSGACHVLPGEHIGLDESSPLVAPFTIGGSQVNVVDVGTIPT